MDGNGSSSRKKLSLRSIRYLFTSAETTFDKYSKKNKEKKLNIPWRAY